MMQLRLLPWEYAVRNLWRRPLQTSLTLAGLTTVILLILVVVGFVRGLERSLFVSGDARTGIVFSHGMGENLEYSSIPLRTGDLVATSISGVQERWGRKYVSPELYLGTEVTCGDGRAAMGLVRGATHAALLVRRQVELEEGNWPDPGEVIVGKLAAAKLGAGEDAVASGKSIEFEGRAWRICGQFSAADAAFESEIWCRLDDLQQALQRQDLSLVAVTFTPSGDFADLDLFCKERLDLELQARRETDYYATLQRDYQPVRWLAIVVAQLIAAAGVFAGLNTMYGAVLGRVRELSTLRTVGFTRRAIAVSLVQEGILLAAAASLLAAVIAVLFARGAAVRFTMGAFTLHIDGPAVLVGCGAGLAIGFLGTLPPVVRALRMPIVDGLKAV